MVVHVTSSGRVLISMTSHRILSSLYPIAWKIYNPSIFSDFVPHGDIYFFPVQITSGNDETVLKLISVNETRNGDYSCSVQFKDESGAVKFEKSSDKVKQNVVGQGNERKTESYDL
jgi:hypothetical protein